MERSSHRPSLLLPTSLRAPSVSPIVGMDDVYLRPIVIAGHRRLFYARIVSYRIMYFVHRLLVFKLTRP